MNPTHPLNRRFFVFLVSFLSVKIDFIKFGTKVNKKSINLSFYQTKDERAKIREKYVTVVESYEFTNIFNSICTEL